MEILQNNVVAMALADLMELVLLSICAHQEFAVTVDYALQAKVTAP